MAGGRQRARARLRRYLLALAGGRAALGIGFLWAFLDPRRAVLHDHDRLTQPRGTRRPPPTADASGRLGVALEAAAATPRKDERRHPRREKRPPASRSAIRRARRDGPAKWNPRPSRIPRTILAPRPAAPHAAMDRERGWRRIIITIAATDRELLPQGDLVARPSSAGSRAGARCRPTGSAPTCAPGRS